MDALRSALRSLYRTPAVTLAAIVTLSAGIGGLCAVFGVFEITLLRPLPVAREDEMVRLHDATRQPDGTLSQVNIVGPHFQEIVAQSRSLTAFAAFSSHSVTITAGDLPEHVEAATASPGALETLGIGPLAGAPLSEGTVVIGEALARARFGAPRDAVGRT